MDFFIHVQVEEKKTKEPKEHKELKEEPKAEAKEEPEEKKAEPEPKKKKRKSHKRRIHHMVFSEDEANPYHDHTKDIVESGEEGT